MKVALITGTNSGIGYASALHLARNGYQVVATMRTLSKGDELRDAAGAESLPLETIELDCKSEESMQAAVAATIGKHGQIDVLVNNAGIAGTGGPTEWIQQDELRAVMETNFFGAYRMMQLVLPGMRERGDGVIINVSSISGFFGNPLQGHYSASKFALEGASRALASEVIQFGIRVICVQPGLILTSIADDRDPVPEVLMQPPFPYHKTVRRMVKTMGEMTASGAPPQRVADVILAAVTTDAPKQSYRVGKDAETLWNKLQSSPPEEYTASHMLEDDDAFMKFTRDSLGLGG